MTEECFQRLPLAFIGGTQWLQWDDRVENRTAIPAMRTSVGTFPPGSQFTRNPIPACGDYVGGGMSENGFAGSPGFCTGSQFTPPIPGVFGFYGRECSSFWLGHKPHISLTQAAAQRLRTTRSRIHAGGGR